MDMNFDRRILNVESFLDPAGLLVPDFSGVKLELEACSRRAFK